MNKPKIMYLRDRNNNPVGCLAINYNTVNNNQRIEYQLSVAAPEDDFDKSMGRQLAIGRLVEKPFTSMVRVNPTQKDIVKSVMASIAACPSDANVIPCRAIKFARTWLKGANV